MTDTLDPDTKKVHVSLGERSYDILVGQNLIESAGQIISSLLHNPHTVIVTDENVAKVCLSRLTNTLHDNNISFETIILPAGESTKSFSHLEQLLDQLLGFRLERKDMVIALGGGVIGDLTGFAASILRRGIDFIQIPTTLLSQVDSSVGGKTGINTSYGKNLIGSFHQPRLVLADTTALDSLPKRQLRAGYAEVVKYGLINDPEFFAWLEKNGEKLLNGDKDAQQTAILKSVQSKASIVAQDETEKCQRALLNLGHTFGHAFEAETNYSSTLLHGEAVALGIITAFTVSVKMGICPPDDLQRIVAHFRAVGLPITPQDPSHPIAEAKLGLTSLLHHMSQDKKVEGGRLTFILARAIGQSFITQDVDPMLIQDVMDNLLKNIPLSANDE